MFICRVKQRDVLLSLLRGPKQGQSAIFDFFKEVSLLEEVKMPLPDFAVEITTVNDAG